MRSQSFLSRFAAACTCAAVSIPCTAQAQQVLRMDKIDPPNWYAALPKPMLLVRGEGFTGAQFSLSDPALRIERTAVSENGHWAQLWLAASPAQPETVQLKATRGAQNISAPYRFGARRADGAAGFSSADVMYLIMPDRFADGDLGNDGPLAHDAAPNPATAAERANTRGWHGGDLRGVTQHLDYIAQTGATAVWITPVYQNHSPDAYHGYHATDYYAVEDHLGTMADLQMLAAALHKRGMKLVLDTVPNHVGPRHPWVTDEPTPDWFHGTAARHIASQTDFDALVDPHAPERDRAATLDGWFVDLLPDNDTDIPAVEQYQVQNAIWWLENTGADALRIDTFPYVDRPFWHAYLGELEQLYPQLTEVGEVSNGNAEITSAFQAGSTPGGQADTRLYTPFDFPMFFAMRETFGKGVSFQRIAKVLQQDFLYPHPERLVPFLGNHDESRIANEIADPSTERLAFALLMTTRGTPQLYAGDEIGMKGGDDPDNRRDFPGGFPGDTSNAFTAAGRTPAQQQMFSWQQQLGQLRHRSAALACGAEQVLAVSQDSLAYVRYGTSACTVPPPGTDPRPVLVIVQRGAPLPVRLDLHATAVSGCRPAQPWMGQASVSISNDIVTITPAAGFIALPCN